LNRSQAGSPAETYQDHFVPAMFQPWAEILLQQAAPRTGERVLDLACGTGIVARGAAPLVGEAGQVVALDMNPAMLAVARGLPAPLGARVDWREGKAQDLPMPAGSFDLVLCQHGLPFMPDKAAVLDEIRRVLAPEGRALVMVLQALEQHPVFDALMTAVARHLRLPLSAIAIPFALSDADALREGFEKAGFAKVDIVPASITARFPDAERFVALSVMSSAAAVPAFVQSDTAARAALIATVGAEIEPVIQAHRDGDALSFPMFAHVAIARKPA
jgi:ubiquinone/menaquinone biosynthesis C-methylase UbiE